MTKSPLYLAGTIYDTYDGPPGNRKNPPGRSGEKEYQEQYRTTNEALSVSGLTDTEIRSLTHVCSIEIKFEGLKTQKPVPRPQYLEIPALPLKPEAHGGNLLPFPNPKASALSTACSMWSLTVQVRISKNFWLYMVILTGTIPAAPAFLRTALYCRKIFPPGYMNLPMRSPGTVRHPMRSWRRSVPICWVTAIPPQLRFWRKDVILLTVSF